MTAFVSAIFVLHRDYFISTSTSTSMPASAMATSTMPAGHLNDLINGVRVMNVLHFERNVNYYLFPAKLQPDIRIFNDAS
jgi:hypothetical protein